MRAGTLPGPNMPPNCSFPPYSITWSTRVGCGSRAIMSFAGFLFGNINEEGELEDEEILGRVRSRDILYILLLVLMTERSCSTHSFGSSWCQ